MKWIWTSYEIVMNQSLKRLWSSHDLFLSVFHASSGISWLRHFSVCFPAAGGPRNGEVRGDGSILREIRKKEHIRKARKITPKQMSQTYEEGMRSHFHMFNSHSRADPSHSSLSWFRAICFIIFISHTYFTNDIFSRGPRIGSEVLLINIKLDPT